MINAVIFDCFGVLTESRWLAMSAKLLPDVRRQVSDVHRAYERGFMEYSEYSKEVMRLTDLSQEQVDDIFIYRRGYQKNTDLLAYIAELSEHYKIGLLSNAGTAWVRKSFLTSDETALFDDMVLSYEVGLTKPDTEIYKLACRRLGLEPAETIFVDDQPGYCEAAGAIGMQAILYKDFVQFKQGLKELLSNPNH